MSENAHGKMTIPVEVDRSHIITIGKRLYAESLELIRELVNNAYDADATEVRITIRENEIEVADNGLGMDLEGLEQYFNIGSQEKLYESVSPKFGRQRIGQFGIGKFASLSASDRTGFVIDSPEYGAFLEAMGKVKEEIRRHLDQLQNKKESRKISRALREAMERVEQALLKNLEICPEGMIPVGEGEYAFGDAALAAGRNKPEKGKETKGRGKDRKPREKRTEKAHIRRLTPSAVVRRVKMGRLGVTCCIDHYGVDGP